MIRRQKNRRRSALHLTQRAIRDIQEIEDHSFEIWGRATADKYLEGFSAAFDRLEQHPGLLRLEPELAPGLYFYRVARHFLVCELQESAVFVLTVIHTSMDISTRLAELTPQLIVEAEILRAALTKATKKA